MSLLRFLLYPIGWIYGFITLIRNLLYDWGVFSSVTFDFPVIAVGNLSMGGEGKTPHVEYLVRLLKDEFKIGVLSRGYKRTTRGFLLAGSDSVAAEIGDEPVQMSKKFPDILVAVDENRVHGINQLKNLYPEIDVIILDDAFQHRSVKPGLSILLTDFHHLYVDNHIFPVGTLREFRCGAKRADVVIVSKSPKPLSPLEVRYISERLGLRAYQKLYFSYISYSDLKPFPGVMPEKLPEKISSVLLFAGIGNIYPLQEYLQRQFSFVEVLRFSDHHRYTRNDLETIAGHFHRMLGKEKIIVTTEKDMVRLAYPELPPILTDLPLFYIPIEVKFHKEYRLGFNEYIRRFVRKNPAVSPIH